MGSTALILYPGVVNDNDFHITESLPIAPDGRKGSTRFIPIPSRKAFTIGASLILVFFISNLLRAVNINVAAE